RRPATQFVAGFFGTPTMNFLPGAIEAANGAPVFRGLNVEQALPAGLSSTLAGKPVTLGVRAEHVRLGAEGLPGQVDLLEPLGNGTLVFFNFGGDTPLVANVDPETRLAPGDSVRFSFDAARVHLFDRDTGQRL